MSSFEQSAAAVIDKRLILVAQLSELERLREQVRKAEQARSPRVAAEKERAFGGLNLEGALTPSLNRSGNRRSVSPT
jgi:hypothetical protein